MSMMLKDTDGVEGTQKLTSSVVNNYVIYHVKKSSQQMWILDDFEHVGYSEYLPFTTTGSRQLPTD